jgi:hypothetical protein
MRNFSMLTQLEARYQALATAGAVLIAFIGLCHESFGTQLYPWGPPLFGGAIIWNAMGIAAVIAGVLLTLATLRIIWFPIVTCSIIIAIMGIAIGAFTAVTRREFHLPAFGLAVAAFGMLIFNRKALQIAQHDVSRLS